MESRRIVAVATLLTAACGGGTDSGRDSTVAVAPAASAPAPQRPSVVFLGTSLTAGLGVDPDQAYPALIQRKSDSAGLQVEIVNRGNSGVTSAGTLATLNWILQAPPAVLVIETGANDGLRGQDPDSTRATIQTIIDRVRARDSTTRIALVQMEAMPNLGRRYVERFHAIYPTLARANRVTLIPFLLNGVAGVDSLNQADGIHPTPRGHRIVAETVWQALRPTLEEVGHRPAAGQVMCVTTPCP
jgi:acyl-CoA thioesterase I